MNINAERFLRMTALIAAASAASCSSNTTNNNNQTPVNTGGTGGSNSDQDGGGGATGKAGATAKGGEGGGGASGVSDGGPEASVPDSGMGGGGGSAPTCLGDTPPPVVDAGAHDAGAESLGPCPDVPTAQLFCQPDSGAEGFAPAAALFCSRTQQFVFRAGVFGAIEKCLAALPVSEACTPKHAAAAKACYDQAAANACPQIPTTDGGDPCTDIHKNCDAVSLDDCHHALNSFSGESGSPPAIASCIAPPMDGGTCAGAFWACVLPFGVTR